MGLNRTLSKREPRRGVKPRDGLLIATAILGTVEMSCSVYYAFLLVDILPV